MQYAIAFVTTALVAAFSGGGAVAAEADASTLLLEPAALAARLAADPATRIIDLRPEREYREGHLPNAVHLEARSLDDPQANRQGLPLSAQQAQERFGALGISRRTPVVAYDASGGLQAARLFFVLEFFGHRDVHILNGGFAAWQAEGRPVTRAVSAPAPAEFSAMPDAARIATAEWVKANLGRPGMRFLDARSPAEFSGADVRASRGGHIPGAVNIDWVTTIDPETKRFRAEPELRALFERAGVTSSDAVVTYCQSGARASHLYFVARLLGFAQVRNYDGSWQDWADRPDMPIATAQK